VDKESLEWHDLMADLKLIKEAVKKSDNLFYFMDTGSVFKGILLAAGLLIALFSIVFYYLLERYGDFTAIPLMARLILLVLTGLSLAGVGYVKIRNFMRGARKMGMEMNLYKLFRELYTARFLALALPNITVIVFVSIFLGNRDYDVYIIPALAVFLGLWVVALCSLFFMHELYLLGVWLTVTGLLTLYFANLIHPLAALGITFAAGFILASLLLFLGLPEKRQRR
jgi:hypothetical protein